MDWNGNLSAKPFKESFLKWFWFSKGSKIKKGKEGVVWLAVVWTNLEDKK